jgi:hypothetical protein
MDYKLQGADMQDFLLPMPKHAVLVAVLVGAQVSLST